MAVTITLLGKRRHPLCLGFLRRQARRLLTASGRADHQLNVVLMDDTTMTQYNTTYLQRPRPANVLAFGASEMARFGEAPELGDVLISVDTAWRESRQGRLSLHGRLVDLMVHGVVHLLGFDHEQGGAAAARMQAREEELKNRIRRETPMVHLAVNVDHVATVRQARGGNEPDPVLAAGICELAGAKGIVVHLREDRRHIQERDVRLLRQTVKSKLNLEMAAAREIIDIALDIGPDMVTLVPEKRQELTTEGGLDVVKGRKKILKTIRKMNKGGIPVSLFIDPDSEQIKAAADVGATFVELHTGRYCDALTEKERDAEFRLIETSAEQAFEAGLRVNAGHGLDYLTTARVAALPWIEELSIGHAVISRAVLVGLDQAVREMRALIQEAVSPL